MVLNTDRNIFLGYIFSIMATIMWSGTFIIVRIIEGSMSEIDFSFYRWIIATIILLPFAGKSIILNIGVFKKNILYLIVTSFLGIAVFNTLVYISSHTTSAINLATISITFPIFIILFSSIIYKNNINIKVLFGIIIVAIGIILLITKANIFLLLSFKFSFGDLVMLIASIVFALYSILLNKKPKELKAWSFQLSTFIIGSAFLLPIYNNYQTLSFSYNSKHILLILYTSVFSSIFAFYLWGKSIEYIGSSKAGMIYYTIPIFSGILSYVFLDDVIEIYHLYSSLVIIFGIIFTIKNIT